MVLGILQNLIRKNTPVISKDIASRSHANEYGNSSGAEIGPEQFNVSNYGAVKAYKVNSSIYSIIITKAKMFKASLPEVWAKNTRSNEDYKPTGIVADLISNPSPFYTATEFYSRALKWKEITGAAYIVIDEQEGQYCLSLLETTNVTARVDPVTKIKWYIYRVGGSINAVPENRMIVWEEFNPTDYYFGMTPMSPLAEDIKADSYTKQWISSQMQRGNMKGGVITTNTNVDDTELERLKEQFKNRTPLSSRVLFLPKEFEFVPFPEGNGDQMLGALSTLNFTSMCNAYGMHPALFDRSKETRTEALVDIEAFVYRTAIFPEYKTLEELLTNKIAKAFGGTNYYVSIPTGNIHSVRRQKLDVTRAEIPLITAGLITVNEWRSSQNLPLLTGVMAEYGNTPVPLWSANNQLTLTEANPQSALPNNGRDQSNEPKNPDSSGQKELKGIFNTLDELNEALFS